VLQSSPGAPVDAVIHLEARHHQYVADESPPAAETAFTRTNVDTTRAWLEVSTRSGIDRCGLSSSVKAVEPARARDGPSAVDETTPGPGR
jgi:nucleoside-diphosphate-sugar epimerase